MTHVKRKEVERLAQWAPCSDFDKFRPLFERGKEEINSGERTTVKYLLQRYTP